MYEWKRNVPVFKVNIDLKAMYAKQCDDMAEAKMTCKNKEEWKNIWIVLVKITCG